MRIQKHQIHFRKPHKIKAFTLKTCKHENIHCHIKCYIENIWHNFRKHFFSPIWAFCLVCCLAFVQLPFLIIYFDSSHSTVHWNCHVIHIIFSFFCLSPKMFYILYIYVYGNIRYFVQFHQFYVISDFILLYMYQLLW